MNTELSRRKFIKTGILGAGTILTCSILTNDVFAGRTGVKFSVKQGKKGCKKCLNAIKAILKDKEKRAELEKLFPANSKVVFYVRQLRSSTKVAENAVAIGACTRNLESKVDAYVPGCSKVIKTDYVYKTIVDKLGKK